MALCQGVFEDKKERKREREEKEKSGQERERVKKEGQGKGSEIKTVRKESFRNKRRGRWHRYLKRYARR